MPEMLSALFAPVTDIMDWSIRVLGAVLIYRWLEAKHRLKKNGESQNQRRSNDPGNPLSLLDSNPGHNPGPGVADLCAQHAESLEEIRKDIRLLRDRVLIIEQKL